MSKSPNRLVGIIFGAVYLLIGLLGFTATPTIGFVATEGGLLIGVFEVNPLHNVIHTIIGAALLIAGLAGVMAAKVTNATIGGIYLLLGIIGFFIVGTELNILALNMNDHFLHLASAILLLVVALATDRTTTTDQTTTAGRSTTTGQSTTTGRSTATGQPTTTDQPTAPTERRQTSDTD